MLRLLSAAVYLVGVAAGSVTDEVTVVAGPEVLHTMREGFVGVTLDWWPPTGGCDNCGGGWRNASVTKIDLQSPRLRTLVSALSPAVLRLGGSLDKDIQYWLPNEDGSESPPPPACQPGSSSPHLCLNASRWDEINGFCAETGMQLAMGLSLNMTQNERLIRYSKLRNFSRIVAFEIPEEYTPGWEGYPGGNGNFTEYIGWYHQLGGLLRSLWVDDMARRPLLVGPCEGMVSWDKDPAIFYNFTSQWVRRVVSETAGVLDVLVYHSYNNDALQSKDTATFFLKQTEKQAQAYLEEASRVSPALPVWLGEGAFHNGGCSVGGCNAFASSMYYIDALSKLAEMGHFGFNRQSLVGGNYELLDTDSLEPNPDFWVAVLFGRLMGSNVLKVTLTGADEDLHVFAHCGNEAGTVTFAFANRNTKKQYQLNLDVAGVGSSVSNRSEYHLTALNRTDEFDRNVVLNGASLALPSYAKLPGLVPTIRPSAEPMLVEPFSVGFAVVQGVHPAFCQRSVVV